MKIKAKILLEVETDLNSDEDTSKTVMFCVGEDLKDLGYHVINLELVESDLNQTE